MVKKDPKNNKYVFINHEDVILAMEKAKIKKDPILTKLLDLYSSFNTNDEGLFRLKLENKMTKFIVETEGVIFEGDNITLEVLGLAFARSMYECNHEMKRVIYKYFVNLMNAKMNEEEIKIIKDLIIADEKTMEYITRYESYDDYIKDTIKKRINKKTKQELKEEKKENRSYVIM